MFNFGWQMSGQEELSLVYEKIVSEIESHIHLMANPSMFMPNLQQLMQAISLARNTLDKISAAQLVQKVRERFDIVVKGKVVIEC